MLHALWLPEITIRQGHVPQNDLRGKITSHRARSTIATQLFNAKEPMSLFELQEWLGHRMPSSTQRYAKITPTKLMKSYSDAGYFSRNLRAIEVLIDQEKVRSGLGADESWKFYDLGHGYCTYDFFDQCPHRMACAKCSFYVPSQRPGVDVAGEVAAVGGTVTQLKPGDAVFGICKGAYSF
jgi:hypothetical protein